MKTIFAVALTGAVMIAAPAMAWEDSQPASDEIAIWAYPSKDNYCPAGLQPVVIGGVICCGNPTHTGYKEYHAPRPRAHKPKPKQTFVSYGKGATDVIVYEKGQ